MRTRVYEVLDGLDEMSVDDLVVELALLERRLMLGRSLLAIKRREAEAVSAAGSSSQATDGPSVLPLPKRGTKRHWLYFVSPSTGTATFWSEVYDKLVANGPMTVHSIAESVGRSEQTIHELVSKYRIVFCLQDGLVYLQTDNRQLIEQAKQKNHPRVCIGVAS